MHLDTDRLSPADFNLNGVQALALHVSNHVLTGALIRAGAAGGAGIGARTVLRRCTGVSRPVSGTGGQDNEGPRKGADDQCDELLHRVSPFCGLVFRSFLIPKITTGHTSKPNTDQASQRRLSSAKRE